MSEATYDRGRAATSGLQSLDPEAFNLSNTHHFQFRELNGRTLITNDAGDYLLLEGEEFRQFVTGMVPLESPLYARLVEKTFLRAPGGDRALIGKLRRRHEFVFGAPSLHIFVVTLRCNFHCVYCHSSRVSEDDASTDMSRETADQALDLVFQSPSSDITIEFQGGEPLCRWDLVKHVIERGLELNVAHKKNLVFSLVTNLTLLDDAMLQFLIDHRVQVCTSLDGPAEVQNKNRPLAGADGYALTIAKIRRTQEAYREAGIDLQTHNVGAICTPTRAVMEKPRALVDTYVELGIKTFHFRFLDPYGMAVRAWKQYGISAAQFIDAYLEIIDYCLELNEQGAEISELGASFFLMKILNQRDPNFLDMRNPCGATIGQIAYNYDGRTFTCDEGRMLDQMGDPAFATGVLGLNSLSDLVRHPTTQATLVASQQEGLPGCSSCAYRPYCGVCPVYNYGVQGSIFGRQIANFRCQVHMAVQDHLFAKIEKGEPYLTHFSRWAERKPQTHFIHCGS